MNYTVTEASCWLQYGAREHPDLSEKYPAILPDKFFVQIGLILAGLTVSNLLLRFPSSGRRVLSSESKDSPWASLPDFRA